MKTIEEMIAVMTACKEGKTIQCANAGNDDWEDWSHPSWNWNRFDYRVKPEPKIRPYANAKEFIAAAKEHGPYVYHIGQYSIVRIVDDNGANIDNAHMPYTHLLSLNYRWQDGHKCGIMEGGEQ